MEFLAVWLLYQDEMDAKLERGADEVAKALFEADVSEIVQPDRASVVKKKRFGLF